MAWADDEIEEMLDNCDKIIFNSISQLQRYTEASAGKVRGLRVNPQVSSSDYLLADPARPFSRLGEWDPAKIEQVIEQISGFMFHNNCENGDFDLFDQMLCTIEERFGHLLHKVEWSASAAVSISPVKATRWTLFARASRPSRKNTVCRFTWNRAKRPSPRAPRWKSPCSTPLYNGKHLAVVDSSIEAHMLDLLIYRLNAKLAPSEGEHTFMVCGKSCLAGDIFGEYQFDRPLAIGDRLSFVDAAGYTMVKKKLVQRPENARPSW